MYVFEQRHVRPSPISPHPSPWCVHLALPRLCGHLRRPLLSSLFARFSHFAFRFRDSRARPAAAVMEERAAQVAAQQGQQGQGRAKPARKVGFQ